jgi:glycosyltransferase involved in cell wall biosynthesis
LVGDKGINELVKAFSDLNKQNNTRNFKLLLVGSLEQELDPLPEDTLLEIKTNPDIIDVGFQKDVRPYFAISNVLTFPSYREGFPNVVMQAGAMELPSIVSDINGCNEIIVESENGTIVSVKDTEELKKAMERMLSDPDYYNKLKNNARPMIESRYEQSVVWNALLGEYKKLIKEKNFCA